MGETRLILVRHGETEWNRDGRIQGQLDVVLSEVGRAQAKRLAKRLAGEELAAVYTSDLARASETAAIVAEPHGLTPVLVRQLREVCLGVWQGLTMAEVQERYAENYTAWRADSIVNPPLSGECFAEVADRGERAVREIATRHAGETTVVVAHGGTTKAVVCRLLEVDLAQRWRFAIDNCSLTVFTWRNGRPVLTSLNDTAHLEGGLVADVEM